MSSMNLQRTPQVKAIDSARLSAECSPRYKKQLGANLEAGGWRLESCKKLLFLVLVWFGL